MIVKKLSYYLYEAHIINKCDHAPLKCFLWLILLWSEQFGTEVSGMSQIKS